MIFDYWTKTTSRRAEIRKKVPVSRFWIELRSHGVLASLTIAAAFCVIASVIVMFRQDVVPYRPGQTITHDILARVPFVFRDRGKLVQEREAARERESRVYKANGDVWGDLEKTLIELPDTVASKGNNVEDLPQMLRSTLDLDRDSGALTELLRVAADRTQEGGPGAIRKAYDESVRTYVESLRDLVIIPAADYEKETRADREIGSKVRLRRTINIGGTRQQRIDALYPDNPGIRPAFTDLEHKVEGAAKVIDPSLRSKLVAYTLGTLRPAYVLNAEATVEAQNKAAAAIAPSEADFSYAANYPIVAKGLINERDWQVLKAEKEAFVASLGSAGLLKQKLGLAAMVLAITAVLAVYIAHYQPRVVRNHARALAIAVLLLAMLLLAQLAAIGSSQLYTFGIGPTILVAMILAVTYDRRFAIGIASMHGILVTAALDQGIGFFLIIWVGVLTCCFLLDEIRTRSKLIEVGGATALAMIAATVAAGAMELDPVKYIARNCLDTGAAGLGVGFIVLGILPFIERAFGITTSMTLLELADASQPLLRRLALEAPGTYNHSLQVATLAEAAADAIGANSLLCRVASYYHDVGKINKPDYFIENQSGGRNRHLSLSPNVSLLIIIGHVKDGLALAKEYNLPRVVLPFIQQHHGTTLVEYFYHKACTQKDKDGVDPADDPTEVPEAQYRYPGPKPKTKEIAIVMLADVVESATRAEQEPTASRIEDLVHALSMKRLMDGQFNESDMTLRELELVERALIKTLLGIYHGRIAYPSTNPRAGGGGGVTGSVAVPQAKAQ